MNEETNSPSDAHAGSGELSAEELRAVEQRLRAYRPRDAELDIRAIEDAAAAGNTPASRLKLHAQSSARWVSVVAGSWMCGAAVGALVMFAVVQSRAPERETAEAKTVESAITPAQSPEEKEADGKLRERRVDRQGQYAQWNNEPLQLPVLFDPQSTMHDRDGFLLRAGTHLRRFTRHDPAPADTVSDATISTRDHDDRPAGDAPVRSGVTRRELMKDLLESDLRSAL